MSCRFLLALPSDVVDASIETPGIVVHHQGPTRYSLALSLLYKCESSTLVRIAIAWEFENYHCPAVMFASGAMVAPTDAVLLVCPMLS